MDPCGIKHGRVTIELARSVNCSPPVDRDGEVTWLTGGATWGVGCRAVVPVGVPVEFALLLPASDGDLKLLPAMRPLLLLFLVVMDMLLMRPLHVRPLPSAPQMLV